MVTPGFDSPHLHQIVHYVARVKNNFQEFFSLDRKILPWYYTQTMAEGPKEKSVTDTKDEVKNGDSWTNVRYFASFEEADQMRRSLKAQDRAGLMNFKIKRCGEGGSLFVVKSRVDEVAKAELEAIEEKLLSKKSKKNNK